MTCGPLELQSEDVLLNPQALVEVLSSSTEQYDRGLKWVGYQRIPSLTDYVLVAQTDARIEHYQRASDGSWTYRVAVAGERITLSTEPRSTLTRSLPASSPYRATSLLRDDPTPRIGASVIAHRGKRASARADRGRE